MSLVPLERIKPSFGVTELNLNPIQDGENQYEPSKVFHGVHPNTHICGRSVLLPSNPRLSRTKFVSEYPDRDDRKEDDCFHDVGYFCLSYLRIKMQLSTFSRIRGFCLEYWGIKDAGCKFFEITFYVG